MTLQATDAFGRGNGALGNADIGGAWSVLAGSVTISGGRAVTSSSRSIAVLPLPAGSQDATVDADCGYGSYKGGYALYFRVTDASNWWRLSVIATSSFVATGGYTCTGDEYTASGTFLQHYNSFYSDTYPPTYYYGDGRYIVYSCSLNGYSVPVWSLRLEKCVAGSVSTVASTGLSAAPTHLRVVAIGNSISAGCATTANATVTLPLTATDAFNASATSHGLGFSEATTYGNTDGLDNFTASSANSAPFAATGLAPAGGVSLERLNVQRLSWLFGDPDSGDVQSKADIRWRVGAGAWNTILTAALSNQFYDAPAATFPLGTVEWQVGTYDSQGVAGPWSASAFFTSATTPGVPVITAPVSGGTINASPSTLTWTAAAQESYQVRRVADNAGVADTATVYSDTGEVVSASNRNEPLTFATNNRYEHLQVRVKVSGLWSTWASVRVQVSFTPPLNPVLVAIAIMGAAAIQLTPTNPLGNLLTTNQASLESDGSGFFGDSGVTLARSTSQAFVGAASLQATFTTAGTKFVGSLYDGVNGAQVTAGQVYTAVAHVRAATLGRGVGIRIDWGTGLAYVSSSAQADYADNAFGWTQVRVTGQAPIGATRAGVVLFFQGVTAGEVHYVDAVGLFPDPLGNLVGADYESAYESLAGYVGWFSTGANAGVGNSAAPSTDRAYTGQRSLKVTYGSSGITGDSGAMRNNPLTVIAGRTYTLSAYFYQAAVIAGLRVAVYGPGVSNITRYGNTVTTTGAWTRSTLTFTATATGTVSTYAVATAPTAGQVFYLDAVQLVVAPAAVDWLPPHTENLVTNPSLEVDLSNWTNGGFGGATMTRDATRAYVGTYSAKCVKTAVADSRFARVVVSTPTPGTYTASVWVWVEPGSNFGTVGLIANDNAWGAVNAVQTAVTGAWARVSITFTVPVTALPTFYFDVIPSTGVAAVGTAWVDAAQLEAGSVATPYVDGSLGAGYVWEASENLLSAAAASFEDGTTGGWANAALATLSNSTTRAVDGTKSLLVTWQAGATINNSGAQVSLATPAGVTITLSAWVWVPAGNAPVAIHATDGSNTNTIRSAPSSVTAAWQRLSVTFTPATAGCYLQIEPQSLATGHSVYVDGVQVEQKDHPTTYAAPGTAHASTSRRQFPWAAPPAAVSNNDIYRRVGGVGAGIRVAKALQPNTQWTDYTPASDVDYQYMVRATGANGTTADSAWV